MAKKEEIIITANTTEAQTALARLQARIVSLAEYAEVLNTRFEGVAQASERFVGKLERLGIASVFADAGIFGLVNKVADVGFELKEAAEKTGLSTQQLQYWQYAAKQSNIDSETLTNAMARLNVSIGMAHRPTSQQALAFRFLHVSLRDASGQAKSTNQIFTETVAAISRVKDKGLQAAASQLLLSRSARELLPLMKNVTENSKELQAGFQKYGYTLDDEAIEASERFHKSAINLKVSLESLGLSIGQRLIPVLQPIINKTLDYVTANRQVLTTNISNTILEIARGFRDAWRALLPFLSATWALIKAMGGLKTVIIALSSIYIANLVVSLAGLIRAVWLLNAALLANPFVFVVAALGLIGLAIYKLFQLIKPYLVAWENFWTRIVTIIKKAKDTIGEIFGKIPSNFSATVIQSPFSQGNAGAPALSTPFLPALSPAAGGGNAQANSLNVHLKIDHEGKPQITKVQSTKPVNFTANVGLTR